ncbi:MAG: hypothetical protein ABL986_02125 [Vicinamibacterales bacterium]
MRRFLLTLVTILAVAGAPVAVELCQAACASDDHGSDRDESGEIGHTCHDTVSDASAPAAVSGVHTCGHTDEAPSALQSPVMTPAVGAPPVFVVIPAPPAESLVWRATTADPSPPDRLARTAALRL